MHVCRRGLSNTSWSGARKYTHISTCRPICDTTDMGELFLNPASCGRRKEETQTSTCKHGQHWISSLHSKRYRFHCFRSLIKDEDLVGRLHRFFPEDALYYRRQVRGRVSLGFLMKVNETVPSDTDGSFNAFFNAAEVSLRAECVTWRGDGRKAGV